jgi:hypothetical protein
MVLASWMRSVTNKQAWICVLALGLSDAVVSTAQAGWPFPMMVRPVVLRNGTKCMLALHPVLASVMPTEKCGPQNRVLPVLRNRSFTNITAPTIGQILTVRWTKMWSAV